MQEREDDVIWRVRFRGQWLYICLILEFQSRIDPSMAVRFLTYVGLLYEGLMRAKQTHAPEHRLPPILPLVLYNGRPMWKARQQLSDLIVPVSAELASYQPQLHYLLIDERRYPDAD